MQLALLGLGKMGKGLALNMLDHGHEVVAWNRSPEPRQEVAQAGGTAVETPKHAIDQLTSSPKVVWLMMPAGDVTEDFIFGPENGVLQHLSKGDILIDGANSNYKDTLRRAQKIQPTGIHFLDIGVSGGPGGARNGACMMAGGDPEIIKHLTPLLNDLNVPEGWGHFGPVGSGHFVKMVHNGIEYGMMQAIGEGYDVMKKSPDFPDLDLEKITSVYNHGSVIESRLIGWLQDGFKQYGTNLEQISGSIKHSGEGQWTVETAKEYNIPVPIIAGSLQFREDSTHNPSYTGQVVSVLRNMFGGHAVKKQG